MGLIAAVGDGPVALDTSAFIYWIENHPAHAPLLAPLFQGADSGSMTLVTSALTLLEVLVVPYRKGDEALASQYEACLTRGRGLRLVPIDAAVLRAAALLRARTSVRTPDALQLAAAFAAGCSDFVTNDARLPPIPGLRIVLLDDVA